ncbi:MAG: hypothetical protein ACYSSI_01445, partial [Planctomycetota bacterium]
PFPATEVYQEALDRGLIKSDVWREFAANPVSDFQIPVYEENFKRAELVKLLSKCNRSFYFRPGYIVKEVFKKRTPAQFYREAKTAWKLLIDRN